MLEDRQHAGNAGTASNAQNVARFYGTEGGAAEWTENAYLGPGGLTLKQPVAEATARLLLDDERDTRRGTLKVHHRIGPAALHARNLEHRELTGLEGNGLRQNYLEVHHIVREPAHAFDAPSEM